jgi:uncharacterized oxidoreductase
MSASALLPLDMTKLVPLVTGGGSGIGLGLVEEFLKRGSPKVLITGRRLAVLQKVADTYPGKVFFLQSDAGSAKDREALLEWVKAEHSDCNALINNAGIQRRIPMSQDTADWQERAAEIEINLNGPIHLCTIFIPYFLSKTNETTVLATVSSALAFVPLGAGPVYSATKAGMHNYTMGLRYSLEDTKVRVLEIIPPAVKSNLGGSHDFGEDLNEYVVATMDRLEAGELEVGFNMSEKARLADRATLDDMMLSLCNNMKVQKFSQDE